MNVDKLAKQEACQLFLEQEIEAGLQDGRTPYSIGKDLAKWVEKLFEAKISPRTIEQKARRRAENATSVASDSTPENDSENKENRREQDGTWKEGVSGNPTGRPPKFIVTPGETKFRTAYTGENEWYTPLKYIEAACEVMGSIDLDPATSDFGQSRIKAKNYFTLKEDGLKQNWSGNVWLNPPYSKDLILLFIDKATAELQLQSVDQLIVLTHNSTDTLWFHKLEVISPSLLCFTRGRIAFESQKGEFASPTQGSTFFYFGNNPIKFREIFGKYGFIR